jgi:hypothetical protein
VAIALNSSRDASSDSPGEEAVSSTSFQHQELVVVSHMDAQQSVQPTILSSDACAVLKSQGAWANESQRTHVHSEVFLY